MYRINECLLVKSKLCCKSKEKYYSITNWLFLYTKNLKSFANRCSIGKDLGKNMCERKTTEYYNIEGKKPHKSYRLKNI